MSIFDIIEYIQENIQTFMPTIQTFAGGVLAALFLRRKNGIESSTKELEKIKAGKMEKVIDMLFESGDLSYKELYKAKNYAKIAQKADEINLKRQKSEESKKKEGIPQQDFGWHIQFFEYCGGISDDKLQEIWANILSSEIYNPGVYSLRTLEILKNMSRDEALIFEKVCRCSYEIGGSTFLPNFGNIMENNKVSYDEVLKLEDCELIKGDVGMILGLRTGKTYGILTYDDKNVLLCKNKEGLENKRLDIPEYLFTSSGRELYPIAGGRTDIIDLCKLLSDNFSEFDFIFAPIYERNGDVIRYKIKENS